MFKPVWPAVKFNLPMDKVCCPTSLGLEPEFWDYLREIAFVKQVAISTLISVINQQKGKDVSLASALRIFVAEHYRELAYPCP